MKALLFQTEAKDFTDGIDGSQLLLKLLRLAGLGTRCLSWDLLGWVLSGGCAAVSQTEGSVGSLHGAGVYWSWGIDGGGTGLPHTNRGHGVLKAWVWGAHHSYRKRTEQWVWNETGRGNSLKTFSLFGFVFLHFS